MNEFPLDFAVIIHNLREKRPRVTYITVIFVPLETAIYVLVALQLSVYAGGVLAVELVLVATWTKNMA